MKIKFTAHLMLLLMLVTGACRSDEDASLTVYSGRGKSLVEPVVNRFSQESGIRVDVRYGDTAELGVALIEEGARSRADVFWAQDAGALGAVAEAELLAALPDSILDRVRPAYRSPHGLWIGTSGRARTLAYSSERVDEDDLPASVFDLTAPKFEGRVGWAPSNGSFQAFVTAMRNLHGEDRTREWLAAMRENKAVAYSKNTAIIQGVANGEVDFGLPNHYYLYRFKSQDADFPVEQTSFRAGDIGNLINVAGVAIINGTDNPTAAARFVSFLLNRESQQYFATETFEYPVTGVPASVSLPADSLLPGVELDNLADLEQTLDLLRQVRLL